MKKIISIIIIIILFLSLPISNACRNVNTLTNNGIFPNEAYEENDGFFTGLWGYEETTSNGEINGLIKQGRRSDIGTFIGEWSNLESCQEGKVKGFFLRSTIFGIIIENEKTFPSIFIGSIFLNDTNFNAVISGLKIGKLFIKGTHQVSFLPALTGTFNVGAKTYYLVDENRPEYFTEDENDFREMMVRIWYPTLSELGDNRINYMDEVTFAWLKGRSPIPLITIPDNGFEFIRPYTMNNVELPTVPAQFPVIIFSPGYDGNYEIYSSLIEDLVSHGFIIASINHPYISGVTVFPDSRNIYAESIQDYSLSSVVGDVKFVLDFLTDLNLTDSFIGGRLDLSHVGLYGHSFGGAATLVCCIEDPRFKAGLTLDGVVSQELITDGLDDPFMILLAENSFTSGMTDELWEQLEKDGYRVIIEGSTHYGFTDVGVLLKHLLPLIPPKLLGFGTIKPNRMINITKSFELVFFETYLKNFPKENIEELTNQFPEVQFEQKT